MSDAHFVGEVGQKALIVREGKVLMVNAVGESGWDLPGGRLHSGEDTKAGLLRELQEELGIAHVSMVKPLCTLLAQPRVGGERFMVVYSCELPNNANFELKPDEIAAVGWFGKEDVETLDTHPAWKKVLSSYFGGTL